MFDIHIIPNTTSYNSRRKRLLMGTMPSAGLTHQLLPLLLLKVLHGFCSDAVKSQWGPALFQFLTLMDPLSKGGLLQRRMAVVSKGGLKCSPLTLFWPFQTSFSLVAVPLSPCLLAWSGTAEAPSLLKLVHHCRGSYRSVFCLN